MRVSPTTQPPQALLTLSCLAALGRRLSGRQILCLSFSLAASLLVAQTPAQAQEARAAQTSVRLVIVADTLAEEEPSFAEDTRAGLQAALAEAGYTVEDNIRADATVRVRVNPSDDGLDYAINVDIAADGELAQLPPLDCLGCDRVALAASMRGHAATIVVELEQALARAARAHEPTTSTQAPTPVSAPTQPAHALGALGGVGIGVAALGIGALVAGGVELGRGRIYDDPAQAATERTGVDHRPIGGTLLAVGGVALVGGVTMLVIDLVRPSKGARERAGLVHPLAGPDLVGLGYAGRF